MERAGKGLATAREPLNFESRTLLLKHGVKATRQRRNLANLVFGKGNRHFTAKALAHEAQMSNKPASAATVYNVLNLFAQAGLLRGLAIRPGETTFDTDTSDHCHFMFEDTGDVCDIPAGDMKFAAKLEAPEGYEISRVDVVVRVRPKDPMPAKASRDDRSGWTHRNARGSTS